jgi:hypothetical protein
VPQQQAAHMTATGRTGTRVKNSCEPGAIHT